MNDDTTGNTGATDFKFVVGRIETLTDSQADVMRATLTLGDSLDALRMTLILFMIGMGILVIYNKQKGQA